MNKYGTYCARKAFGGSNPNPTLDSRRPLPSPKAAEGNP